MFPVLKARIPGCGDTMRAILAATTLAAVAAGACAPAKPAGKTEAELLAELPAPYNGGDPAAGKQVFALCTACHTIGPDQPSTVGPNLHGVFGAVAGHKADFKYSPGLAAAGWTWDAERIATWVTDPKAQVPDTKMVFIGVKDAKQRTDLIAYLKVASSQ
jgi:cytochrome c